jgi:hypothetical protein
MMMMLPPLLRNAGRRDDRKLQITTTSYPVTCSISLWVSLKLATLFRADWRGTYTDTDNG